MATKIPVTMKMDPDLKAEAQSAADADSRSFANFVSAAVREKLDRMKRAAKPKP